MKTFATAAAALLFMAGAAMAQGIDGTWQTQPNDDGNIAHVQFSKCGERYCGTLVRSYDSSGKQFKSKNNGKNLVWDMVDAGNGSFKSGKIWDPGADKTYRSKMQLSGDRLKVSGCIAIICKSQTWVRVK